MKWLITGTRHGRPDVESVLEEAVRRYGRPQELLHGGADGVDEQADAWAKKRKIRATAYYALWDVFGKPSGPARNQVMVFMCKRSDLCLALPDANSVGTWDCLAKAQAHGMRWHVFEEEQNAG